MIYEFLEGKWMVKGCNNTDLDNSGVASKYFLFYQVWRELTERKTLDSYQFKVMNTLSILKELRKVIDQRLKRHHCTNDNINECKSEAVSIIKEDHILSEFYPIVKARLLSHVADKAETDTQQKALAYQIEYSLSIIEPNYLNNLLISLKESIDNQENAAIIAKTNQLISCCAEKGWSSEALFNVVGILKGSKDNDNCWEQLKCKILAATDEYHILFPLKVRVISAQGQKTESAREKVLNHIREFEIELLEKDEIICRYSGLNEKLEDNQKYLLMKVSAHDFYSASYMAISKIADILNVFSFYNLINPWDMRDVTWISINTSNQCHKILKSKELYSTYDYLESAGKVFRAAKQLEYGANHNVKVKLRATYSYTNMGKASYAQEEKFMNTWVALESLCRTEMYDNIISNVLETVPPALCLRYIYRLFRNFSEDCLRCNVSFDLEQNTINLKHPSKEKVVKDVILAMNNENYYQEMLEKCSVNNLLVERCKELHQIAVDGHEMFNRIDRHYCNIKRQLSRLYRIRNEIAHSALNESASLIRYIEHLDDYLSSFVSEVVMCWEKNPNSNLEHIFEILKDNYRAYVSIKSSKKSANPSLLLQGLRETGVISLI